MGYHVYDDAVFYNDTALSLSDVIKTELKVGVDYENSDVFEGDSDAPSKTTQLILFLTRPRIDMTGYHHIVIGLSKSVIYIVIKNYKSRD